jgi:AraC family transcriptional regulator
MTDYRIVERPGFEVIGKKTWISGQDNDLFGRFWEQCKADGLFEIFEQIGGLQPGPQTRGVTLGVSRVEKDPTNRAFYYLIGMEKPKGCTTTELETYRVPASQWAVFECRGKVPDSIVKAEIYAFTEWLPASGFVHANAPEMEVYPPESDGGSDDNYCEFWLPIESRPA